MARLRKFLRQSIIAKNCAPNKLTSGIIFRTFSLYDCVNTIFRKLFCFGKNMHEMSLALNIYQIALEEAQKNNCNKLLKNKVEYGALSGIMHEALEFCLKNLFINSIHADAEIELLEKPIKFHCKQCDSFFTSFNKSSICEPCPNCGESMGHEILEGYEMVLSQIEACKQ